VIADPLTVPAYEFPSQMQRYLDSLVTSKVMSLADIVQFNLDNAELELPPGMFSSSNDHAVRD
jgi:hypothetical protein